MRDHDEIPVETEEVEDGTIFRPQGEIDLGRSPSLRTALAEVQAKRPRRLIIDLADVPYMDSSGVATLVEAMQVSRRHDGRIILCNLQDRVRSIFEIARLDMVFTIVDSGEDALTA